MEWPRKRVMNTMKQQIVTISNCVILGDTGPSRL